MPANGSGSALPHAAAVSSGASFLSSSSPDDVFPTSSHTWAVPFRTAFGTIDERVVRQRAGRGPWIVDEHWVRWQEQPHNLLVVAGDSDSHSPANGASEHDHHHSHHFHHDVLSPVATIMVAFASTLFAIRLIRELATARPAAGGQGDQLAGEQFGQFGGNVQQLTVETPANQPFRPFSGRAYSLTRSAPLDESQLKDTSVLRSGSIAPVSAGGPPHQLPEDDESVAQS